METLANWPWAASLPDTKSISRSEDNTIDLCKADGLGTGHRNAKWATAPGSIHRYDSI